MNFLWLLFICSNLIMYKVNYYITLYQTRKLINIYTVYKGYDSSMQMRINKQKQMPLRQETQHNDIVSAMQYHCTCMNCVTVQKSPMSDTFVRFMSNGSHLNTRVWIWINITMKTQKLISESLWTEEYEVPKLMFFPKVEILSTTQNTIFWKMSQCFFCI